MNCFIKDLFADRIDDLKETKMDLPIADLLADDPCVGQPIGKGTFVPRKYAMTTALSSEATTPCESPTAIDRTGSAPSFLIEEICVSSSCIDQIRNLRKCQCRPSRNAVSFVYRNGRMRDDFILGGWSA